MTNSQFEYVRKFELPDMCLPNCWPIVRIDGKNFHKFSHKHEFEKPNDARALKLMSRAAQEVMNGMVDVVLAYGQSDEYSFVFKKSTTSFNRRASKLSSLVVSQFASAYVFHWKSFFPDKELLYPPAFDARTVLYPSDKNLRDYLSWRQVDCHINNLQNTTFWALVHSGLTPTDAQERLKGTLASDKNEILFAQFGINYNNLEQIFRKGTVVIRDKKKPQTFQPAATAGEAKENKRTERGKKQIPTPLLELHVDVIKDEFWKIYPHLLDP
uniref:tRNA(His) guanylyltransferase n=1 Tax=Phallusia mammillata TaxID=59560 RepID=A0A6F9DVA0_9ASCI|nr:probable tRNA(His) guanylyltransferase [Phallusia mammillata]